MLTKAVIRLKQFRKSVPAQLLHERSHAFVATDIHSPIRLPVLYDYDALTVLFFVDSINIESERVYRSASDDIDVDKELNGECVWCFSAVPAQLSVPFRVHHGH